MKPGHTTTPPRSTTGWPSGMLAGSEASLASVDGPAAWTFLVNASKAVKPLAATAPVANPAALDLKKARRGMVPLSAVGSCCSPQLSVCLLIVGSSSNGIEERTRTPSHSGFWATAPLLDLRRPPANSLAGHSHDLQ